MKENLPKRLVTYDQEEESIDRFRIIVPRDKFFVRNEGGRDYGVDLILELRKEKNLLTNFRTHIQMKSVFNTKRNCDGSLSFPVPIKTLNYLMNQANSIFIVYIVNEDKFLWEWTTNIFMFCRNSNINISDTDKKKVSYKFTSELSEDSFNNIYNKIMNHGEMERKLSEYLSPLKENCDSLFELLQYYKWEDENTFGNGYSLLRKPTEKINLAQSYISDGNYKRALEIFTSLADIYETEFMYINCAILSQSIGKYSKAIEYSNKLLKINPKCFEAYFVKGTCLGERKKYSQAIKNLEKALNIKQCIEAFHNLGYIYFEKGERDNAIECLNRCLESYGDSWETHLNIAVAYFDGFRNEKALYHINESIRINDKCYRSLSLKGEILRYLGEIDNAIKYFDKCISYNNRSDKALFGLGLSLIENKNIKEGIIYLSKWLGNNKEKLFKDIGGNVLIIDIGWKRTLYLLFELVDSNTVNLILNDDKKFTLRLPSDKDYIFIGCAPNYDKKKYGSVPFVGKIYEKDEDYKKTIKEIKDRVELFNFFDERRFITVGDDISVYIEEKKTSVYIELRFKDYRIFGVTNTKSEGYYEFIRKYQQYGCTQVNICNRIKMEEIIISGVKKVNIKKY